MDFIGAELCEQTGPNTFRVKAEKAILLYIDSDYSSERAELARGDAWTFLEEGQIIGLFSSAEELEACEKAGELWSKRWE